MNPMIQGLMNKSPRRRFRRSVLVRLRRRRCGVVGGVLRASVTAATESSRILGRRAGAVTGSRPR